MPTRATEHWRTGGTEAKALRRRPINRGETRPTAPARHDCRQRTIRGMIRVTFIIMLCALAYPWSFVVERRYTLSYCVAGPKPRWVGMSPCSIGRERWCKIYDIDRDGDVDLRDVAAVYVMPTWRWISIADQRRTEWVERPIDGRDAR